MRMMRLRVLWELGVLFTFAAGTIGALGVAAPVARAQTPAPPAATSGYTPADARFMQGMIAHHAQALEMTALVPSRTTNRSIRLLAERIEVSQKDEIGLMRRWLLDRHEPAPDPLAAGRHEPMPGMANMPGMRGDSMPLMPGMLTRAQVTELAAAKDAAFDRLFLTDMIQHHQGALVMVQQLFATPGAGQEPEAFQFASDVQTDQTAEIARMQGLLSAMHR